MKRKIGFAVLDKEQRTAIAKKGGHAVQAKGTGYRFTSDEAKRMGKLGGTALSTDREHMREIGRKGGKARAPYLPKSQDLIDLENQVFPEE